MVITFHGIAKDQNVVFLLAGGEKNVFWEGLLKNRYFGGSTEKIGIWGSTEKKSRGSRVVSWQVPAKWTFSSPCPKSKSDFSLVH